MATSISCQVFFPHPPERVWGALTNPAALERWLMPNDFQARLGHRFTFRTDPVPPHFDGVVYCQVTELEEPRRLAYTWRGGPAAETLVTYRLEPKDEGTLLHFEHSGFDLSEPAQRAAYDAMSQGWISGLEKRLREVVGRVEEAL